MNRPAGIFFETDDCWIFFGENSTTKEHLKNYFKNLHFSEVQQEHGSHWVTVKDGTASDQLPADGLLTKDSQSALAISTADCLPVFIFSSNPRQVAAVHVGWRGIVNGILPRLIESQFKGSEGLWVWIGPHIQKKSFEVDAPVKDQLWNSLNPPLSEAFEEQGAKTLVRLSILAESQIRRAYGKSFRLFISGRDTKIEECFHSHRRTPTQKGRQISFIALKPR